MANFRQDACPHNYKVYVSKIKLYEPQPASGGKVFTVELICQECNVHLTGQLQVKET